LDYILRFFDTGEAMARATIRDVALQAGMSISTVNRALHEPEKVRQETLQAVLAAAEAVGFYGIGSIRSSLISTRPKVRVGILLLQRNRVFYQTLSRTLEQAAAAVRDHDVVTQIEFLDELTPQKVSDRLQALGERNDFIGVVATEHPIVASAIERLAEKGVRSFALISALTARCSVGYVGLDAWKVGRTSAWAFDSLCRSVGKIAILVGNHRYRCQETNESGFRSYFREHQRGFELLEARTTFETASIAEEVTEQILTEHPDLVGLYVSGGGLSGAIAALRNSGRSKEIICVGYDITEVTRPALIDGTLNFVIAHPLQTLANEAIAAMIRAYDGGPNFPPQAISLPFEIYTSENL
jgi:LacI family transcriptional regulator